MFGFLTEKHEVVYNIMLIIVGIFIIFLVNWIRNIYINLEQKGPGGGPSKDLNGTVKQVNARIDSLQGIITELGKDIKALGKKYGEYATHVIGVEKSIDTEKKKMADLQKTLEEKLKKIPAAGGPEISKQLLTDLKEKLEYILDKFKVHDDQLVNLQKIVSKSRDDIDKLKSMGSKIAEEEIEKVYETISSDKNLIANLNERTDTIQDRMSEQGEQIEILQKIFEDIDADLVEIDKYFKSLSKSN